MTVLTLRRHSPASPVRAELQHGLGPWAAAVIAATVAFNLFVQRYRLGDNWIDSQQMLRHFGVLTGGPVALAAGCWHGGRERRCGTGDLFASAARTPLVRALAACLPAVLWPVGGYLLPAAATLGATWPYVGYGHPSLAMLGQDIVTFGALGALGFAAGRALRWRMSAPLLGPVGYVVLGFTQITDGPVRWLTPAAYSLAESPAWASGLLSAVWMAGLAVSAVLAGHARRRAIAVVPLLAAAAAAALLCRGGDDLWRPERSATAQVCSSGTPVVCVRGEHASALPAVKAVVARIDARLDGVPGAPVRYRESAASESAPLQEVRFQLSGGLFRSRLGDSDMLYRDLAYFVTSRDCGARNAHQPGHPAAEHAALSWMGVEPPMPTGAETQAADRLRAMPAEQRRAWLGRYLDTVPSCDTSRIEAP
ncbi:hypothetical protein OH779_26790 [Actinacidiphila glaucinigra]|uniref:hypothetical protein n=1 Tax=Actinacidiphila glaucinigra TaxID=235986 RepID=UPI00386E9852